MMSETGLSKQDKTLRLSTFCPMVLTQYSMWRARKTLSVSTACSEGAGSGHWQARCWW